MTEQTEEKPVTIKDKSLLCDSSQACLCLGKAPSSCLESPCCLLSVSGRWERPFLQLAQGGWGGVCCRNLEGGDGWCPRSSRADSILAVPSALLPQPFLTGPGACPCLELKSCVLLEAFRNCQRGKADSVCSCSFPRSVILHHGIKS